MRLSEIKQYLRNAPVNFNSRDSSIASALASLKQYAITQSDQALAKELWCFERILAIQDNYTSAFDHLKSKDHYDVWCEFERTEIELHFLSKHFKEENGEYHTDFIEKHIKQYQSLFPYRIFGSSEELHIEKVCSICNTIISIRNSCGHELGEIYDGEMCGHEITKAKLLGMAVVEDPGHRYSVLFPIDSATGEKRDHYNYSILNFLVERLLSPFHGWEFKLTKQRHPHSRYKHVGRNAPCPCESSKKYRKCCGRQSGVLRPHYDFIFSVLPPSEMMKLEYVD